MVYMVSAVLNVEYLDKWTNFSFSKKYFEKGLSSIYDVVLMFDKKSSQENLEPVACQRISTLNEARNGLDILFDLSQSDSQVTAVRSSNESHEVKLKKEISFFELLIKEKKFSSTTEFWCQNADKLPNLHRLALRLLSIPASSAHIERFFSLSGAISLKKL